MSFDKYLQTSLEVFEEWAYWIPPQEKEFDKIFGVPESEEVKLRMRAQFQRDGINMIKENMSSMMVSEGKNFGLKGVAVDQ